MKFGEVEYGLQISPQIDPDRHQTVRQAMRAYRIWEIDRHTAEIWARIRGELFCRHAPRDQKGRLTKKIVEDLSDRTTGQILGIQENDLWIVSVAVQYDLRFITTDRMTRIVEVALDVESYDRFDLWELG